jgi:signal transduction histidine kinase
MQSWQTGGPAVWEHRSRHMVTVVPYVLLAVMAGVTVAVKHDQPGSLTIDLVLCAAAAIWSLVLFTLHPPWRARPVVMGVFLGGMILFGLVMVLRDPWFGLYTPALYFYAFRVIGWPHELWFIAGTAVVAGTAQASGLDKGTWAGRLGLVAVVLVNVAPMCLLALFGETVFRFYDSREAALREAREANERLATAMAETASLQRQLLERARDAGVLDERARMAREIHDTVAQGLIGIVTQLQAADQAAGDPAEWRRHHTAATTLARESLTEARRSVNALRPRPLETARLAGALTEVAAGWSARHDIPAQVTVTGDTRPLPPQAETALLRVAQEALANVAKHAGRASRVGVTLSYLDRLVALDVRDDGDGFDPAAPPGSEGGFGLVGMRQRVEALAGTLQIESEPGGGTAISACVPTG